MLVPQDFHLCINLLNPSLNNVNVDVKIEEFYSTLAACLLPPRPCLPVWACWVGRLQCCSAAVLQAQPPTARSPNLPSWKALYNTQAELQDYHLVAVPFRLIFNNFVKESLQVDILTVGMLPYPICRVDHHRVQPGQVELQQCSIHPIQFAAIFAEFRRIRNLFTNQYLEVFKFFLNS